MTKASVLVSLSIAFLIPSITSLTTSAEGTVNLTIAPTINTDTLTISNMATSDPSQSLLPSTTISYDPATVTYQTTTESQTTISIGSFQTTNTSSLDNSLTTTQPVSIQGNTSPTTTTTQPTYYYGPPELVTSSPAAGDAVSGSTYPFSATISDPNNLVRNVRFKLYDPNRNLLSDTNSTLQSNGRWLANTPFNSTNYPDGYGYYIEITAEGDYANTTPQTRYTLGWTSVYFGIDNVKTNDIMTYPDVSGSTIVNKELTATAYQYIPYGDMPVASTIVQYYFLDALGNRIPQGSAQTLTKDPSPYSGLWSANSLDTTSFFTQGNGRYIAAFTATYTDGATKSVDAPFELYISNDVTPPVTPQIVSPKNGITMLPGNITYKWTGNEGDDIIGLDFERGDVDPLSGAFIGRAGGYQDMRDGSFSWTDTTSYVPTEAYTVNWRIRVKDRAGNWSAWSAVSRYTIDPNYVPDTTPPPKPALVSPTNNQNVNSAKIVQTWRSDASDIAYYTYESYGDAQHKKLITREKVLTNSRTTLNQNNGALWWRVQATDTSGNNSEWSDLSKMTVSNKK